MGRSILISVALAALLIGVAAAGACGSGDKPSVKASTLTPSPGATTGGQASPGATPSPTSTLTLSPSASPGDGQNGTTITDKSIKAGILARIAQSAALADVRIKVQVFDRVVLLGGTVKRGEQKTEVEQIAVTEPGIKKVISRIVVEPQGSGGY